MIDEQNLMNTNESVQHRKVEMFIEFAIHKSLNRSECRMRHHFSEMNSTADDNLLTQFLSLTQLSNVMKLKQRLLPFSVRFDVNGHFVFGFIIFHL